ncbi:MAG: hypothetical protein K1X83_13180 [Oligoflexia bacterium]|nr:hypothetical protein [Oligoflexia bacterium]
MKKTKRKNLRTNDGHKRPAHDEPKAERPEEVESAKKHDKNNAKRR